ncbi:mitochondrial import receptor subunit TOM20 homolog [Varroa jacobsoni]|uniref:Mitochondrial import receptor subunit TOM20 homolog n=1 Tax=Varroa destructor TaxID=109461 RepID=A0A7M7J9G3_VARDE|nr:mitochondrial import receptor subunit TOM20 homolog [Varroa destructor]XP_022689600.1 mitochondrial import receptor subunit TOM20 homolog [Varroa jacobsoni]
MLPSSTSNTALVAAGIAGTLFLGYCIYFDHRRRSDPLYKQKIRERRQKAKKEKRFVVPDTRDQDAVQKFFLQEVQTGETLLHLGDTEGGIEHLSAAVAICEQPQQLLQILQHTLPPQVFNMMLNKLPEISRQLQRTSIEEDVE